MKAAVPTERAAVEFDSGVGLAEITPPPCVEFEVAASPETITETVPCETAPPETTDTVEVGDGTSTPDPAVAFEKYVDVDTVKTCVPPVPSAGTEVGNSTPPPSFWVKVDVPE